MLYSYLCYVIMRLLQTRIITPVTVLGVNKRPSHNNTSIASEGNIHNIQGHMHDMYMKFIV